MIKAATGLWLNLSMQCLLLCYKHHAHVTAVILLSICETCKLGTEAAEVTDHADKKLQ